MMQQALDGPIAAKNLELQELDLDSDDWAQDPLGVLDELHAGGWLARSQVGYEILSHEVCTKILTDTRFSGSAYLDTFRDAGAEGILMRFMEDGLPPTMDGERHARIRRVFQSAFRRRRVDEQRTVMRTVANQLIDNFQDAGECDFVSEFTQLYPIEVVCRAIGIPVEDIPQFMEWTLAMGHMGDHPLSSGFDKAAAGIERLADYVGRVVAERRRDPKDDFITTLIEVQGSEGELTEDELVLNIVNLLFAGQDTTQFQLAWTMKLFWENPQEWQRFKGDRSLASGAIDESMRMHPAVRYRPGTPTDVMVHRGIAFEPGEILRTNFYAANHDPNVFAEPNKFDIGRFNANKHLTFSHGIHRCLGAALAQAEMIEALNIFADRIPEFEIVGDVPVSSPSHQIGGVEHLQLTFAPAIRQPSA